MSPAFWCRHTPQELTQLEESQNQTFKSSRQDFVESRLKDSTTSDQPRHYRVHSKPTTILMFVFCPTAVINVHLFWLENHVLSTRVRLKVFLLSWVKSSKKLALELDGTGLWWSSLRFPHEDHRQHLTLKCLVQWTPVELRLTLSKNDQNWTVRLTTCSTKTLCQQGEGHRK